MSDPIDALAAQIRTSGGVTYVNGTTTAAAASGRVTVDIGGKVVTAHVPGSFRANVTAGATVRLARQQNTYTLDSILSALAAPTVAAPASSLTGSSATSSGCYDYSIGTNDWTAVRAYTRDIATATRGLAGDINALVSRVADLESARNTDRAALAALRTALIAQGHIV